MSKLPKVSGQECVNALKKTGFYFKRQQRSHIILRRDDPFAQVVVPNHKELDRGTLRAIIRQANLGIEEFQRLRPERKDIQHTGVCGGEGNLYCVEGAE